jgi:hypothetical protein
MLVEKTNSHLIQGGDTNEYTAPGGKMNTTKLTVPSGISNWNISALGTKEAPG